MRMLKIPNLEYEQYNAIRNSIYKTIPFAIINNEYLPDLKMGFFNFWDVAYIPDVLRKYIMQPPVSREDFDKMKAEIVKAFPRVITDKVPDNIRT